MTDNIWDTSDLDAAAVNEAIEESGWVDHPNASEPIAEELGAWVDAAERDIRRAKMPWTVRKGDPAFDAMLAQRKRFELSLGDEPDRSAAELLRLWNEAAGD